MRTAEIARDYGITVSDIRAMERMGQFVAIQWTSQRAGFVCRADFLRWWDTRDERCRQRIESERRREQAITHPGTTAYDFLSSSK